MIGFREVLGKSVIVICALGLAARAQPTRVETDVSHPAPPPAAPAPAAPASDPDPAAEEAASEANLESIAPRAGMTFSISLGGGITLGDGVGRGPVASFRVGHVATPRTVLTLELTINSLLHQMNTMGGSGPLQHNDTASLMPGALYYVNRSFWIRGAGGLVVYTTDNTPPEAKPAHPGLGGLFGVGLDLARWHYLVLGLEAHGQMAVVTNKGLIFTNSLCLNLTYY